MRRYPTYPPHRAPAGTHRAPIGALSEGRSMRLYRAGILHLACPIDKTNFPRILNPRGAKRATIPQLAIGPVPEHRLQGRLPRDQNYVQPHGEPLSSCTPGFSIKRIFPEYWSRGPGNHWTLLQYPHGPVPEHCLALPGCTAAGSPVPIYPLGLDKTNFPRIPENIFILK